VKPEAFTGWIFRYFEVTKERTDETCVKIGGRQNCHVSSSVATLGQSACQSWRPLHSVLYYTDLMQLFYDTVLLILRLTS